MFLSSTNEVGSNAAEGKEYYLNYGTADEIGVCPSTVSTMTPSVAKSLLTTNNYNSTTNVAVGSCRLYFVGIYKSSDDSLVNSATVYVSNI